MLDDGQLKFNSLLSPFNYGFSTNILKILESVRFSCCFLELKVMLDGAQLAHNFQCWCQQDLLWGSMVF